MNNIRRPVLDEIDHAILRHLASEGRMPNLALASAVGIAPSTCLGRVRALRESGVIRGYHADIDLTVVGLQIQAVIAVRMQAHNRDQIQAFVTLAPHLPGVVEVFHIGGYGLPAARRNDGYDRVARLHHRVLRRDPGHPARGDEPRLPASAGHECPTQRLITVNCSFVTPASPIVDAGLLHRCPAWVQGVSATP